MRKIVSGLFISLDGVIESANDWMGPWFSAELGQAVGSMIAAQDAMLLGRVTYEEFAAHWPQQTGEMADSMNGSVKYVVSGTLKSADWQNSTLIPRDRAAGEITALKHQPGKNIGMTGSATLVSWLLRQGLLDELHLLVFPVVLGSGKRLFGGGGGRATAAEAHRLGGLRDRCRASHLRQGMTQPVCERLILAADGLAQSVLPRTAGARQRSRQRIPEWSAAPPPHVPAWRQARGCRRCGCDRQ